LILINGLIDCCAMKFLASVLAIIILGIAKFFGSYIIQDVFSPAFRNDHGLLCILIFWAVSIISAMLVFGVVGIAGDWVIATIEDSRFYRRRKNQ